MKKKLRLDQLILSQHPELSRTFIQSVIMQGKVFVDGQKVDKPGMQVAQDAVLVLDLQEPKFVSRAGFKLEKALDHFAIDVTNAVAMDAGLSTGGFTDCLLQRGAQKVYGIDVGYGQVHEKIRNDARVIIMERINLRNVQELPELVDIVTLDLSFISVLKVIEVVKRLLKPAGKLVVLIKPQFESERDQIPRGGIIRDAAVQMQAIAKVTEGIQAQGFNYLGYVESPITGADGNKEFLAYFVLDSY